MHIVSGHFETEIGPLRIPKEDAIIMSEVLKFFNNLFDSVNGYTIKPETHLRTIIKKNSAHHAFWKDAIPFLKAMRYVHPVSKKPLTGSLCIQNWIKTIEAFQHLWKVLEERDFKQFKPRYINQDPLENFFGCIRAAGCRNINPTCTNFCGVYKILLMNNLSSRHKIGRNCEDICDGNLLFSLRTFISETQENDSEEEVEVECTDITQSPPEEIHTSIHTLQSSSVYIILRKNLLAKAPFKKCHACKVTLTDSADMRKTLQRAEILVKKCISKIYFKTNILSKIECEIEGKLNFTFMKCLQHNAQMRTAMLNTIISIYITKFCTAVNRCLNGKCTSIVKQPILISAQKKYKTRIKKKSLGEAE